MKKIFLILILFLFFRCDSKKPQNKIGVQFFLDVKYPELYENAFLKLRKQIEQEILSQEISSDKQQNRLNKFNRAFLEDECTICLEDLDDDKGKTQLEKCLKCIDRKDQRIYLTGIRLVAMRFLLEEQIKMN